jgi:hypothetical protein
VHVQAAFVQLDRGGKGVVDAAALAQAYDPTQHPDVLAGRATADHILSEFVGTFDVGGEVDGMVTLPEFVNYYANVGANIDNDDYFELLVRNVWHVPVTAGGAAVAAAAPPAAVVAAGRGAEASSVHRVLVTRADGSQYVEEEAAADDASAGAGGDDPTGGGVHRMVRVNKRRSFVHHSTDGILGVALPKAASAGGVATALKEAAIQNAANTKTFQPRAGVQIILARVQADIAERGVRALIGLQRKFREVAGAGRTRGAPAPAHKLLTLAEFKRAFKEMYFGLSDADLRVVFDDFDLDGDGLLDAEFFLRAVRAPMGPRRLAAVERAFAVLDKAGAGVVDATEVAAAYDPSAHPDVVARRATADKVRGRCTTCYRPSLTISASFPFPLLLDVHTGAEGVPRDI